MTSSSQCDITERNLPESLRFVHRVRFHSSATIQSLFTQVRSNQNSIRTNKPNSVFSSTRRKLLWLGTILSFVACIWYFIAHGIILKPYSLITVLCWTRCVSLYCMHFDYRLCSFLLLCVLLVSVLNSVIVHLIERSPYFQQTDPIEYHQHFCLFLFCIQPGFVCFFFYMFFFGRYYV